MDVTQKTGMSFRTYICRLTKLVRRFANDPDPAKVIDAFVRERFLQVLPKDAQQFVRGKEPKTAYEAGDLATLHFSSDDRDADQYRGEMPHRYARDRNKRDRD